MSGNGAALLAVIIVGLVITVDDLSHGKVPGPRNFIALAVLWIILAILGDTAPGLAKALAVLVVVAAVWKRGPGAIQGISKAGGRAATNG